MIDVVIYREKVSLVDVGGFGGGGGVVSLTVRKNKGERG